MKKYIIPLLAAGLLLTSCDDQIMEWGRPSGENAVTSADIPLAVKEVLANYGTVKSYSAQYMPNCLVGLGMGGNMYAENFKGVYKNLSDSNFQMFTMGNAMKMDAIMGNSGTLNFTNLDKILDSIPTNEIKLYGHNFIWYQQQNQTYLKSLIAPTKVVVTDGDIANVLSGDASNFNGGTSGGWGSWGSNKQSGAVESGVGIDGSAAMVIANKGDDKAWNAQFAYTFSDALAENVEYTIRFKAKSTSNAGELQFQYQNGKTYGSQGGYNTFTVGTDWTTCEYTFTITKYDDVNRIMLNFGKVGGTYTIDDIQFGQKVTNAKSNSTIRKTTKITYTAKTAAEKRTALLGAMDGWISGMANHLKEKGITPYGYDVVNEPITDGTNLIRGVDAGAYGGSSTDDDGNTVYDSEPTETETEGLTLNWGTNHFYWGYYVKDYALQAFQMARKYLPSETKLFINDYNLESSPAKLAALIAYVKQIDTDNGSAIVDGIGTQTHFDLSAATDDETANDSIIAGLKTKVDQMFQTLAATGKIIRVTELDVRLGTSSPSTAQYKAQAETYRMIFESYKKNIPEAQQSGITIWTLSDNEDEHTYWLKGDVPNIFDASYLRKWAYKGVCDGIAGEDIGLKFGGDDYKAYYEKNNVSTTVSE